MTQEIKKNIRRASLLLVGSIFLSRILGFVREWILAHTVGANAMTDVYLASFTIPDFLNYLLATGAINISLIPILADFVGTQREELGKQFFQTVVTVLSLLLLILIGICEVFAPELTLWVAPGFDPEQRRALVELLRIILPAQFFFFWGGLANGVQQTHGRFVYSALAPIFYNLGIIVFGVALYPTYGVKGFSIGVLVGSMAGYGFLQAWGLWRLRYPLGMKIHPSSEIKEAFRKYFWMTLPIILGFSLVVADEWISKYFASFMTKGTVSWLSFARIEMRIPIAIIGQAAGIASFPYLSKLWSEKNHSGFSETLISEIQKVWALAPLAAILMVTHADSITYFIFGGGRMTSTDLEMISQLLRFMALGVVFWILQVILARGFYATQTTWVPSLVGTVLTVLVIPLYSFLARTMGVQGLALAGSLGIAVYTLGLWVLLISHLKREGCHLDLSGFYKFLISWAAVVALLFAGACGLNRLAIFHQTAWSALLDIVVGMLVVGGLGLLSLRTVFRKFAVL